MRDSAEGATRSKGAPKDATTVAPKARLEGSAEGATTVAPKARLEGSQGRTRKARRPWISFTNVISPGGATELRDRPRVYRPSRPARGLLNPGAACFASLRTCPWLPSSRAFGATARRRLSILELLPAV